MRGTGATRRNSRCVALAVGVVTGFVDGDFDVQVLLAEYGECGSRRGAVEPWKMGWLTMVIDCFDVVGEMHCPPTLAELYTLRGRRRHSVGHVPRWR